MGAGWCRLSFPRLTSEALTSLFATHPRPPWGDFVGSVTCPEGVHRTYYWKRRVFPPNDFQVTLPSLPMAWGGGMGEFFREWQIVQKNIAVPLSAKPILLLSVVLTVSRSVLN